MKWGFELRFVLDAKSTRRLICDELAQLTLIAAKTVAKLFVFSAKAKLGECGCYLDQFLHWFRNV